MAGGHAGPPAPSLRQRQSPSRQRPSLLPMQGVLTLPLMVSTARVTGGRWSDFSSICQPITVMLPTRSLSADLPRATRFGKWCRDWAPFLRKLSICHRGPGRAGTWPAGQLGSTCCTPRLQGRQTGNPSPRSASVPGDLRGGASACSPGLTPDPHGNGDTSGNEDWRELPSGTRPFLLLPGLKL